ncbi:MAG: hypothetical protein HZY73_16985 [Micropruina sp.]|nr:MAG: hypothetical protein HZY73_16985 [Micropruina sp.]
MQIIDTSLDLDADAADVWQVWADVDSWPQWDPHEESARIITEFATGGRAYSKPAGAPGGEFTLVEVTPTPAGSANHPSREAGCVRSTPWSRWAPGAAGCASTPRPRAWERSW